MPLTRAIARGLMGVIPERGPATIYLSPDSSVSAPRPPETVNVYNAWEKPIAGKLQDYGHVHIQGDETLIKVPDHELNPTGNGREIRTRDKILWKGQLFIVTYVGTTLKTVQTQWECVCRKDMPT